MSRAIPLLLLGLLAWALFNSGGCTPNQRLIPEDVEAKTESLTVVGPWTVASNRYGSIVGVAILVGGRNPTTFTVDTESAELCPRPLQQGSALGMVIIPTSASAQNVVVTISEGGRIVALFTVPTNRPSSDNPFLAVWDVIKRDAFRIGAEI